MVMQSFFPRFLPRKRLKYCRSISFLSSPLWLKTSKIFRHMAKIFAFGEWPALTLDTVLFGITLNVGQRHRRRANINPPWFKALCWYSRYSRQCVVVTCISSMPCHCVRLWPAFKWNWCVVCYVHAIPPARSTY